MAFTDEREQAEQQLRVLESLGRPLDSALTRDSAVPEGDLSAYAATTVTPGGVWFDARTLTCGQELCVKTERKRFWIQAAKMLLLCRVGGRCLRG